MFFALKEWRRISSSQYTFVRFKYSAHKRLIIMSSRCVASSGFCWGAKQERWQHQRDVCLHSLLRGMRVTYVTETFPFSQSCTLDWPTNRNPYQSATGAAPFQRSVASLQLPTAVPVELTDHDHPRAGSSVPWPDGSVTTPQHVRRKWLPHRPGKPCR